MLSEPQLGVLCLFVVILSAVAGWASIEWLGAEAMEVVLVTSAGGLTGVVAYCKLTRLVS